MSYNSDDVFWDDEDNSTFGEICSQFHDETVDFLQNGDLKEDIELLLDAYDNQPSTEYSNDISAAKRSINKSNAKQERSTDHPPPYWSHSSEFIDSLRMGLNTNTSICENHNPIDVNYKRKLPNTQGEQSVKKRRKDRGISGRSTANVRERTRMRVLSSAFDELKEVLPWVPPDTRLSKLETLKLACSYIEHLNTTVSNKYKLSYNQTVNNFNCIQGDQ